MEEEELGLLSLLELLLMILRKNSFKFIVNSNQLVSLYGFENEKDLFLGLMHNFKFCLLTLNGIENKIDEIDFAFSTWEPDELEDKDLTFYSY